MSKSNIDSIPVTVNAIRINGKKLTKSIFDQFRHGDLLSSSYFVNLKLPAAQLSVPVIARHNYQIKQDFNHVHYLFSLENEICIGKLNPHENFITKDLEFKKLELDRFQKRLDASNEILKGKEIDVELWNLLNKGVYVQSFEIDHFIIGDFDDAVDSKNEINRLRSKLENDYYLSDFDISDILKDQHLQNVLRSRATDLSNINIKVLPKKITDLAFEIGILFDKYELVTSAIKSAPIILIGV